jgi:FtsH-binding integral membrane protein
MLTAAARTRPASGMHPATAAVIDVCCVIAFVAIGRASHHHGESAGGLASTAWPFLAGLAAGLLASRAWRRPAALVPAGLGAWLGAVAVGMLLRVLAGQGTAMAFIVVALAFLGLFLLGWRALAAAAGARRGRAPSLDPRP